MLNQVPQDKCLFALTAFDSQQVLCGNNYHFPFDLCTAAF